MGLFRKKDPEAQYRDILHSISDPAFAEWLGGLPVAGVNVNERTAMSFTAVFRAVSIISGAVAQLPLKSYRKLEDGSRLQVSSVLDDPGAPLGLTPFEWVEQVMVHLLLHGNAFLQHLYSDAGALVGLAPLHPTCVSVEIDTDPTSSTYARKLFKVSQLNGSQVVFTEDTLTHIPGLGLDGVVGLSPIGLHRTAIGTGLAGDKAAAKVFESGLTVAALVSSKATLTKEQADAVVAGLRQRTTGAENAGGLGFVPTDVSVTPLAMNLEDAQFIESRAFQIEEIARMFGLPTILLSNSEKQTSWGTGVAEILRATHRFTLAPWTSRLEQRLSRLVAGGNRYCEFSYEGFLQPSPEVAIPLILQQIEKGLLTLDEGRALIGRPPLEPATTPTEDPNA